MRRIILFCLFLAPVFCSCKKVKSYLQEPETQVLGKDLQTSYAIAYSANIVLTEMKGYHVPGVTFTRSNAGYPCTTLAVISADQHDPFLNNKIGEITISGLWSDSTAAMFAILFTNFNLNDAKFSVLGINAFPLICQNGKTIVLYGAENINLNPNSDELLSINLTNSQVESEYAMANQEQPNDVYVAVEQKGYFININNNNTVNDIADDLYTVTGGGQVLQLTNTEIGIFQEAMVGVEISSFCLENPTNGYALLKKLKTKDNNAPELGTVVLEFNESCNGQSNVTIGTGIYLGSNGKSVGFAFD
jgi:hypothetical protein